MSSIKIYKLLQKHVSDINLLVFRLGNESVSKGEVTKKVTEKLTILLKELS